MNDTAQKHQRPHLVVAGADIDLGPMLATGRAELGPGRYETLLHLGDLDGHPLLTFTAPWHAD